MFGVKLEEPEGQTPVPPRRSARRSAEDGESAPRKMFFGVEVPDDSPGPSLEAPEREDPTHASLVTVSTLAPSRLTVALVVLSLFALSAAAWQLGQLRSARKAREALTQRAVQAEATSEDLRVQLGQWKARVGVLEDDKTRLTEQLALKSLADEAASKSARTRGGRGKHRSKTRR